MAFLAPVFLLGIGLLALPFWLHRLETDSAVRRPFASAMLLEAADRRIHVQRKLRYLALLALRCGLLALVAFAFAKPFFEKAAVPFVAADGSHLVVVDVSASMQREGSMDAAQREANDALSSAPNGAQLQVFTAGSQLNALSEAVTDKSQATALLGGLEASAERTDFGDIMAAIDRVAEGLPTPVTVHFVSDFQSSGLPSRFADLATSNIGSLHLKKVAMNESASRGIVNLQEVAGRIQIGITAGESSNVDVVIDDVSSAQITVPADITTVAVEIPELEAGDHAVVARIVGGDSFAADDERFAVIERLPPTAVPVITRDALSLSTTYIATALTATGEGYDALTLAIGDFDPRVLSRYRFAIVDDIGALDEATSNALEAWLNDGGRLLAFAGQASQTLTTLPLSSLNIEPASLRAADAGFVGVGAVDTAHPALAQLEGWSAVRFTSNLPAVPEAADDVLMRLETGSPLLLERRIGQGRLMTWLAGVDNASNDLPIQPVFVGLIAETARYLGGFSNVQRDYAVGDSLVLPSGGGQVVGPDGRDRLTLADTGAATSITLDQTGVYTVYTSNGEYRVAANPDPRELRTEIIEANVLADWASLTGRTSEVRALTDDAAAPDTADLWPWLLALAALFLIGESVLANILYTPVRRPIREASA